jgi:signal transduction histidine kinase
MRPLRALLRRLHGLPLAAKLAAILLAAVLLALGVVYALVAPRLESRLVDAKLDELEKIATETTFQLAVVVDLRDQRAVQAVVDRVAGANDVRAVVLQRIGRVITPYADSQVESKDLVGDALVEEAAETVDVRRGRASRGGEELAEVVRPILRGGEFVFMVSARLSDAVRGAGLLRKSLIIPGLVALAVSVVAGVVAQLRYTRRIRRLEHAAERLAGGDFALPVPHEGDDELGQLASAMERMRVRLDHLDRARKAFIANASHELKTPLFALGGFLELLADDDVDEATRRDFTDQMREQVHRLTRLTADLLDLSRLDAGELPVSVEPVDLAGCAEALADQFRAAAEASGRELTAGVVEPVTALADESWVLRVGAAVVENAIRHTPPRTRIRIDVCVEGRQAVLRVVDDGPGVQPDELPHLFDRFYRGSGGIAHGSGLGLSIAAALASRMGGSLDVRSRPGETSFSLRLPAAATAAPREREPLAARS